MGEEERAISNCLMTILSIYIVDCGRMMIIWLGIVLVCIYNIRLRPESVTLINSILKADQSAEAAVSMMTEI